MRFLVIFASFLFAFTALAEEPASTKPKIVGWVETIRIQDVDMTLRAKLDTGAKTSSLDAHVLETKKNANPPKHFTDDTVVFSVMDEKNDKSRVFERDVLRYVRIKLKEGGFIRRPVVKMMFCVAGRLTEEEVNLAERDNFIYRVLIGRNMMQHAKLIIDASRTFVTRPTCKKSTEVSLAY